ncbi:GL11599 [Drosophila persimilis]|uniref:GL11599 n=1 Tax=Drosophila persimilis TaxID=7234 RepID=B4GC31_DROPE|nr:GL11599 [Drosophila persimilis]
MNGVSALLWLLLSETVAPVEQLRILHETLESVHKEHGISTLLVMQRRHQKLPAPDPLQPFYPLAWPTLRFDEGQRLELVTRYNKVVLALLYIDANEDLLLLDALAEIFNQMREARIGKEAKSLLDEVPPRSFVWQDRNGIKRYSGLLFALIQSFATKRNISLKLGEVQSGGGHLFRQSDIIAMTLRGDLDLPMTAQMMSLKHRKQSSTLPLIGILTMSIAVPCGKELGMGDMFNSIVVVQAAYVLLGGYILFTVVESLMGAIYNRLAHRRCDFRCLSLLINQRVFRSLLGMPVPFVHHRVGSALGQLFVVMGFVGLLGGTYLGAELSTLLTTNPQYQYIRNLKQLRDSNLTVFFNAMSLRMISDKVEPDFLSRQLPNVRVIQGKKQMELISSLNTSYAYQIFSYDYGPIWALQQQTSRKALCISPGLDLLRDVPTAFVLQRNSLFGMALAHFVDWTWSVGLMDRWYKQAIRDLMSMSNVQSRRVPPKVERSPIQLGNFHTVWTVLAVGYVTAVCALIGEWVVARTGILRRAIY